MARIPEAQRFKFMQMVTQANGIDLEFKKTVEDEIEKEKTKRNFQVITNQVQNIQGSLQALTIAALNNKNPLIERKLDFSASTEKQESFEKFRKEIDFIYKTDPRFQKNKIMYKWAD